jgi:hypothetical protein
MRDLKNRRVFAFATISILCVLVAVAYGVHASRRTSGELGGMNIPFTDDPAQLGAISGVDRVMFRTTAVAQAHGRLVATPLAKPGGQRYLTALECERVDIGGDTGVCLTADRGFVATYGATIFDSDLRARHKLSLQGIPSRTRVSPDGKLAAITTFVSGHSYAGGDFSTRTVIVDTASGTELTELERFSVSRQGVPIKSADFNFWGVTFAPDSNIFYATLGTGQHRYLVEGDARRRVARVLRDGVECPSISPDATRLGFKKRTTVNGRLVWRLAVLELTSLEDRVIEGETRSIDDQVEWLDAETILYSAEDHEKGLGGTSVWAIDTKGGSPRRLLAGAFSPSVVRAE